MVEGARLESVCTVIPYRGFESRLLRHTTINKINNLYKTMAIFKHIWSRFFALHCLASFFQEYTSHPTSVLSTWPPCKE